MRGLAPGRADPDGETIGQLIDRWLPPGDLRRLVAVRGLRSFTQGYIMVVFSIYLGLIGFPAWLIGVTLTLGGLASAGLTLLTGVLSDRVGRRIFLLIYSVLLLVSGLLFSLTTVPWVLIVVSALGGLGRGGGGGGAGPFAPAEQAMIAEKAAGETRRRVFGVNAVVGTLGGAAGALLAGVPELLRSAYHLSLLDSYRPLYLSVALVGILSFIVLWPLTEAPRRPRADDPGAHARRKRTRATIGKISFAGAINGFGMGFIAGIVPYWLHVRYGVSAGAVGPIMTVSSLLTSGASLVAVRLAMRYGDVALITSSRLVTAALTLALPFAPVYPLAAVLYGARRVTQMMAMPVRMSYTMGIVEAESRGSAAGMNGVSMRLPASVSPSISGYWIGLDELGLPFFAAAFFATFNAVLYWVWFRRVRPLDEPARERPAAAPPASAERPAAAAHSATHPAADK